MNGTYAIGFKMIVNNECYLMWKEMVLDFPHRLLQYMILVLTWRFSVKMDTGHIKCTICYYLSWKKRKEEGYGQINKRMKCEEYLKGVIYKKSVENVKIVEYKCVTWVADLWFVAAIIECTIKEICYVSRNCKVVPEHGMRAYKGSESTTSPFLSLSAKFKWAVKCTRQKTPPPPPSVTFF